MNTVNMDIMLIGGPHWLSIEHVTAMAKISDNGIYNSYS